MAKATTIKEALKRWEEQHEGQSVTEATDVQLQFQWLPIEKMDATLSTLVSCEKLSLSTNMIEKIIGLNGLTNLRILSLSRNNIKSLAGIEVLADNLEQLWCSYNIIDRIKGIEALKKLEVFYCSNNMIKDFTEINRMAALPKLRDLLFVGNPCMEDMDNANYRRDVCRRLQQLKVLDGVPIVRDV